jgi:aspartyl-tRNA(Asn)/glutamyl-tRNA(Gln) amidotransferase subunit B
MPAAGCLRQLRSGRQVAQGTSQRYRQAQLLHSATATTQSESAIPGPETVPFRQKLKGQAKQAKKAKQPESRQVVDGWELTVGIEIHAQLNTRKKLFSGAYSTIDDAPNTRVALFDVAMPGSQPTFQKETLIPALRAALALNCDIQKTSRFDRKHYFHWDQPSGYQITQYYQPFAKDGYITLYKHDGIAEEDGEQITIGIKQIQMEQDTAKTNAEPGNVHLLDFNRVGLPLIEIITLPQIHYPSTAAAFVRKAQILLNAVNACTLGLESGGLRADVNVSVRRSDVEGEHEYAGVKGLGQRTEIKNLSSFNAIERSIIAERDRQIEVIEKGNRVISETRRWIIGQTKTWPLRKKEGEVDYRYMPDPDLGPIIIGEDVISHLRATMGLLPDEEIGVLTDEYGLTAKDALTLLTGKDGGRVEYFHKVVDDLMKMSSGADTKKVGRLVANWVLHEMGALGSAMFDDENPLKMTAEGDCLIPHIRLAKLLHFLDTNKITGGTAKKVLAELFNNALAQEEEETKVKARSAANGLLVASRSSEVPAGVADDSTVEDLIDEKGLWFRAMSDAEYEELATSILDMDVVEEILSGKQGKINFLLGQMMRKDTEGRVDAQEAMKMLRRLIEKHRK